MKTLSGLVAYYPLGEASGNAINNAPATRGSLNGTLTSVTQAQTGKLGGAYLFSDTNSYVALGTSALLNPVNFTFVFMIKFATTHASGGTRKDIVRRDTPYILDFKTNGQLEFAVHNGGSYQSMSSTKASWAAGQWFMVAMVNDSTDASAGRKIYINGVQDATTAAGISSNVDAGKTFTISAPNAGGALSINATVQHCALFSRALTATEALNLAKKVKLA